MKKSILIAVMVVFIVSLSGCANTDHPQTMQECLGIETVTSEIDRIAEPEESSSASVSESKESSDDSTVEVKAETESESAQAENSQPAAEQSPAVQTQPPQTAVPNDTPKPEPPQEITPAPEEPAVPEFNIQTWIDYAKTYAVNVGLRLECSAVDCWDNPITAGAYSTCLERIFKAG